MENRYNYLTPNNKVYMAIIAVLILTLFYFNHIFIGISFLVIYAILALYNIKLSKVRRHELEEFIENLSSKLDIASRNILVKLPFPLIIVGSKGKILWYNQRISGILKGEDILDTKINSIIKNFNLQYILEEKEVSFQGVLLNNRYYDVYSSIIDTDSNKKITDKLILLYFYDINQNMELINNIKSNKEAIMLIEVDNFDEVIDVVDDDKKPLLMAEIETTINNYAQSVDGMIKKYASNKYVIVLQHKFIQNQIEKKFDILDNVRSIDKGNKLAVTLSIGVGMGGDNPYTNHKYASSAIELALGRGGDQVIIKDKDKLSFYGGKTKEVEKRTRVRARVISHALLDIINQSSKVFIMGHKNPDIDCLGAAVGLHSVINAINKENYIILGKSNDGIDNILQSFKKDSSYQSTFITTNEVLNILDEKSLLILVDVHSKGYVEDSELVERFKRLVIVDHHRKATDFIQGAILTYIEPYASSSSELVTEMIQYMSEKPELKPLEAEALLAGICIDTKNFYFKTGVRTFEAAAFLKKLGADTIDIKKLFASPLEKYINKLKIMENAQIKDNIVIAICPEYIKDSVLAAQVADEFLNVTNIKASFVIMKTHEDVYISGRSLGDINVQLILETLGGGGHMTMAGAKLISTSINEAIDKLKNSIDKYLREGEIK